MSGFWTQIRHLVRQEAEWAAGAMSGLSPAVTDRAGRRPRSDRRAGMAEPPGSLHPAYDRV